MRKGYTHKLFKASNANGLSEFLAGKSEISKCVQTFESSNFDFITRGVVPPNPAELLMHKRFDELLPAKKIMIL